MKQLCIIVGYCLASGATANFLAFDTLDLNVGQILQTRSLERDFGLLPRMLQAQRPPSRSGVLGFVQRQNQNLPPNRFPAQIHIPFQRQPGAPRSDPSQKREPKKEQELSANKDSPNNKQKGPNAKASIVTKGSAAIHVMSPSDYHDAYNGQGKEGRLDVEHYHKVLAAGSVQGDPGTPIADAAKQEIKNHPLIAKGQARAVSGQVTAPRGGAGHIKIETPDKTEEFSVAGGKTRRRTGVATGDGEAKVTASVTHGGHVRVIGALDRPSLKKFPVQELDWREGFGERPKQKENENENA